MPGSAAPRERGVLPGPADAGLLEHAWPLHSRRADAAGRPRSSLQDPGASFYYYGSSLGSRIHDAERGLYARRGDRFWLLGYTLLFLAPSLILFAVGLRAVGAASLALWLVYVLFMIRYFPRVQTARESSQRGGAAAAGSAH
jgi:hypothetical protein